MPAKAEVLAHELPEIRDLANTRAGEGWDVDDARTALTEIQAAVGEVKEASPLLEVDLLDLSDRIEGAEATLFAITYERPGGVVVSTRERLLLPAAAP